MKEVIAQHRLVLSEKDLQGIKEKELIILRAFCRFCEDNNLQYYIIGGTLIGAVRHKGFIPWDDDIDVGMPFEDYCRFLSIWENKNGLFLQTHQTEQEYLLPWAKLRLENSAFVQTIYQKAHIHHGIWIDVFPLIRADGQKTFRKKVSALYERALFGICGWAEWRPSKKTALDLFKYIGASIIAFAPTPGIAAKKLWKHYQKMDSRNKNSPSQLMPWFTHKEFPALQGREKMPFEDLLVDAPSNYCDYLTSFYGDYMTPPPIEERHPGHEVTFFSLSENYLPNK